MTIVQILASEFGIGQERIEKTVELLDGGNTVPFIARYRKEVTGGLDDTLLRGLSERLAYLRGLEKRRAEVISLIDAQGKLTPAIEEAVAAAATLTEIDDIYRPFRPKRKTKASVARERGLEPLAAYIREQRGRYDRSIEDTAEDFVDPEKEIPDAGAAIAGALDIITEEISDDASCRKSVRTLTFEHGNIVSKGTTEDESVYSQYYEHEEPLKRVRPHRVLAMNRGEKEGFLKVSVAPTGEYIRRYMTNRFITDPDSPAAGYMTEATENAYSKYIAPAVEREIRNELTDAASEGAIKLFCENTKQLLMQPPLKGMTVMGFDPGYRTGCKLAVIDRTGKVLWTGVVYPTKPQERFAESEKIMLGAIKKYGVKYIAVGNGTASKESVIFISGMLRRMAPECRYTVVSEAGASVYSASETGAEEFPDFDATQRSAVSIARRLQDPLAELVKIDPKSIGVGQYQHDMKPARLDEALGGVVEDCVNTVGVDLNTASYHLLSYVSGIGKQIAVNIVKYRDENGEFTSRRQLMKVPKLGAKAYEQCAGFLRVPGSREPLDNTAVHPESYDAARGVLAAFGYTEADLARGGLPGLGAKLKEAGKEGRAKLCADLGIGGPTLDDIVSELEKPGRDVRGEAAEPEIREDLLDISSLKDGMVLDGTVRNITDFGVFVDVGVHQDGFVHISKLSRRYVRHPLEVVSVGQRVKVKVIGVDTARGRISLTMVLDADEKGSAVGGGRQPSRQS